ncbi:MAG: hypothetical protein ACTHQ3_01385 [Motilibacteraceae bacterium]
MWVHLENWIVQDGEIPELHVGSVLRDHGLRAACWSIEESQESERCLELAGPDPSGDRAPHYALSGTVEWGREPSRMLLRVGDFGVLAEPRSFRRVPGSSPQDDVLERFSPAFFVPARGTRVTALCRLEVLAAYETDERFGVIDIRRDWDVRQLQLQHRTLVPVPGRERERSVGRVLRVDDIERMHRWADDTGDDYVTYLLDLQPTT